MRLDIYMNNFKVAGCDGEMRCERQERFQGVDVKLAGMVVDNYFYLEDHAHQSCADKFYISHHHGE